MPAIRFVILPLLAITFLQATAQQIKYTALLIPDSLQKDADAVVREESTVFNVKDINTAAMQVHKVVTVMNSDGKNYLTFSYTSDKFDYLDDAEVIVYNAMGIKMNTYSKKEMHIYGYGEGLVEDGKTTWFQATAASYPITVEINYSVRYKGILNYPTYYLQRPWTAVQQSTFSVQVPTTLGVRYKLSNSAPAPVINQLGEATTYTWKTGNLAARKMEKGCGSFENYLPFVLMAPNHFQMDDYAGDMTDWNQFGKWYSSMINTTAKLSDTRKAFFRDMVKDASTNREKAAILYHYLQQNMRYVSIQLGIGGWRPFAASFVDEKKYGDCKALSNYMQSVLDAVGIKSYNVLIHYDMGINDKQENALQQNFPINRFNHAILCIPQPKDSIWLECTSTTIGFGELGSGTQNHKALLITETGGVLAQTPCGKPQQNIFGCRTEITLNENGGGLVATSLSGTGNYRQQMLQLSTASNDEKRNFLLTEIEWRHPDDLQMTTGSKTDVAYTLTANMKYDKIPSFSTSSKMFLSPRLYPLYDEDIPENTRRMQDYYFYSSYQHIDTTVYHLPAGYGIDYKPEDRNIINAFGSYNTKYTWDEPGNTVTIIAHLEISQPIVKAADYQQLSAFCRTVQADTNEKLVVKKL